MQRVGHLHWYEMLHIHDAISHRCLSFPCTTSAITALVVTVTGTVYSLICMGPRDHDDASRTSHSRPTTGRRRPRLSSARSTL